MYRGHGASPIFDVPEFPSLRRVKPLPKRRRTIAQGDSNSNSSSNRNGNGNNGNHNINANTANVIANRTAGSGAMTFGLAMGLGIPVGGTIATTTTTTTTAIVNATTTTATTAAAAAATAEEILLAHADSISAQMALQSYYMPILGGVQDLFKINQLAVDDARDAGGGITTAAINAMNTNTTNIGASGASIGLGGFGFRFGVGGYGRGRGREKNGVGDEDDEEDDEEDDDEGRARARGEDRDYVDHLRQPGNTKKRKVPANASGRDVGSGSGAGAGEEDEPTEKAIPTGRGMSENDELVEGDFLPSSLSARSKTMGNSGRQQRRGKGKITRTTLAGLQHKEMLKTRKRQLAAVLGALSHGDTLALDQALSANFPFLAAGISSSNGDFRFGSSGGGVSGTGLLPKVRLSRRQMPRRARVVRILRKSVLARHPDAAAFPKCEFTFVFASATSDRLIATKEEVAQLRSRFEAELARQATKAAKLAAASKLMKSIPRKASRTKRIDHTPKQQAAQTVGTKGGEQVTEFLDQSLLGVKPRNGGSGKKKKRSALANASNPHHLKNYIPSRLPHSGQAGSGQQTSVHNSQNHYLGPAPLRFLSADIPPRRRKKKPDAGATTTNTTTTTTPLPQLTNPMDEWICAFCEHRLFFGGDQEYRRAIRMRKKILRRRRRARERAAAAASGGSSAGNSTSKLPEKNVPNHVGTVPKPTKLKTGSGEGMVGVGGEYGSFG